MRISHKQKREPQSKSKSCNAPRECKSPNSKTKQQQTSLTIPNCNPQISKNQMKRKPFSHTLSSFTLSLIFRSSTMLIWRLESAASISKPRRTRLLFHTQKENHSYSKRNSKSSSRQDF